MTVGGKDIGSPSSKGDAYPKTMRNPESSQWVGEKVVSNFFKKVTIYKARQLDEKTSAIKEALTLMEQLRGDTKLFRKSHKSEAIYQQELVVAKLQDEVNTLESTPIITEEATEALATICRSMEAA
ncbi:hypothetical protein E5676_scaffold708G00160 [Cucumis melo var. makuwa]|uniref:Uncharacterized protein n=1 Tax=Cucumis melo var. makuwa TaxID=1194695 RepID=A0A5D3D9Q0_CUCMM|nr:hypothetical protein E6C27_scaffold125G001690 [Cucumis melo var. makuwa]TYK20291.1 hypothetical protein E5676_scaffold708G00160 [Cucumis melo var. makuwa]